MNGENLYNAAMVMKRAGEEIEAMLEKLTALLDRRLNTLGTIQKFEQKGEDLFDNSNEWVFTDLVRNFSIYKKSAKNPSAYLALQIKLCDRGEADVLGSQPLLYVLFCSEADWELDEFLLHKAVKEGFRLERGCLWRRYDDNEKNGNSRVWWKDEELVFVLPLVGLNTQEDLEVLIIDPIYSLLTDGAESIEFDQRVLKFKVEEEKVSLLK